MDAVPLTVTFTTPPLLSTSVTVIVASLAVLIPPRLLPLIKMVDQTL